MDYILTTYSLKKTVITVQQSSDENVVSAIIGKRHFWDSVALKPLHQFLKKFRTVDYVDDTTLEANFEVNRFKGGVAVHA